MSILVQREFRVAQGDRARFEEQSRRGLWPALHRMGALMVGFGAWGFGGPGDVVVTHTCYTDFDHWLATRNGGAAYPDEGVRAEIDELRATFQDRGDLVQSSSARLFDLDQDLSRPQPVFRRSGDPLPPLPPGFGRGSVISERTLGINAGRHEEFKHRSAEVVWPWLEEQGGRLIGVGHDLMSGAHELTTWFAFPSLPEWHRLARPSTAGAPADVVEAFSGRGSLIGYQRGRLLLVGSDWAAGEGVAS